MKNNPHPLKLTKEEVQRIASQARKVFSDPKKKAEIILALEQSQKETESLIRSTRVPPERMCEVFTI